MAERKRMTISASVNKDLYAQLKELSKETRIPMSRLFDEGIEYLLKKHETPRS